MHPNELIVIGGGLVGAAIAYGAARHGAPVTLLDQGDTAHRASRGNFGLLWVQGKGGRSPAYARWSRDAVSLWPSFAKELLDLTGIDIALHQPGGFWVGFSDEEIEARAATLARIDQDAAGVPFQMMSRAELRQHLPGLGTSVAGGSYCPLDGHANPLKLMHALHAGLSALGARVVTNVHVEQISVIDGVAKYQVHGRDSERWCANRVVIAAGLGSQDLASQVQLDAPVFPKRGQVLITERLERFLDYPTNKVRQTHEGSVQLGSSTEEVGFDDGTTIDAIETLAKRAVDTFPALSSARLVRAWGALRVMTPDGLPVYQESAEHPGAFVATSHSGVTLAAAHARLLGPWMAGLAAQPEAIRPFPADRFRAKANASAH